MNPSSEIIDLIADIKEQVLYLQELGVESLSPKMPDERGVATAGPEKEVSAAPVIKVPTSLKQGAEKKGPGNSRLTALPSLSKLRQNHPTETLIESGSALHREAQRATDKTQHSPADAFAALFDDSSVELPPSVESIADVHADIGNCTRCPLYEGRTQIVHSKGNLRSNLMFVGEAPGADEDAQGAPFVGRAGQLLTKIIEGIGIKREDVFIGNINRCRPPGNRTPTLPEAEKCKPFLLREIAIVRPRVIVVMGNTATQNLLNTKIGITRLRGEFQDYFGVKVMPTFHPAYLLRDPNKKREVWEDMKKVRDYLRSQDTAAELA